MDILSLSFIFFFAHKKMYMVARTIFFTRSKNVVVVLLQVKKIVS